MHRENLMLIKKFVLSFSIIFFFTSVFASGTDSSVTPDAAIDFLKKGNARYQAGNFHNPRLDNDRRTETVENGQHPFATIITCSDSRIPLEHVFDMGIGDIFVIRVAGNVVNTDEAGSIEYGVDHLGTPVFVVLGHTGCGAVTAVVKNAEVHGNIPELVANIAAPVEKARAEHGHEFSDDLLKASIENNVWQSIDDLFKKSAVSRERVEKEKLKVIGAIYNLETGAVEWLGEHPQQEQLLKSYNSFTHKIIPDDSSFTRILFGYALVLAMIALFIVFDRIYFNSETRNKKYQIGDRIKGGYTAFFLSSALAVLAVMVIYGYAISPGLFHGVLVLVIIVITGVVYMRKYTNSLITSFKNVISALKKEVELHSKDK